MNMTKLQIHKLLSNTKVEGPFTRAALWLQGCSINCPQCCNPHMLDSKGGERLEISKILEELVKNRAKYPATEGISILGGEPLDQASELFDLFKSIRTELKNYGIILFTGYSWQEITNKQAWLKLVKLCDLVIAGPFKKEMLSRKRRWIGSDNQTVHFVTSRYETMLSPWPKGIIELEFCIDAESFSVTGTPLEPERKII